MPSSAVHLLQFQLLDSYFVISKIEQPQRTHLIKFVEYRPRDRAALE